jgi:hypothetical protein
MCTLPLRPRHWTGRVGRRLTWSESGQFHALARPTLGRANWVVS